MFIPAQERIIVSLDVATEKEAVELACALMDCAGFFKIGLELLSSAGVNIARTIAELGGKVFVDGKFNDIPNTVAGAAKALTRLAVKMFDVHTMAGLETMKSAVRASTDEASRLGIERPLILGVTVLTSIDQGAMNEQLRISGSVGEQVVHLARLAEEAGLDGIIASPQEIGAVRKSVSKEMLLVTPGIRPYWAAKQDQKRVMSPGEAVLQGADYLVIGRPILKPPAEIGTPIAAAQRIAGEIAAALKN